MLPFIGASLVGCGDPRTGGIRHEVSEFEQAIVTGAWRICGARDPMNEDNILNEQAPIKSCYGRLGWRLSSCERDALINYPAAAREHFEQRLSAQWSVALCCQDVLGKGASCTADLADACIADLNRHTEISDRVVTPGLELYFADDNSITSEALDCLDTNGWTHQGGMLPRVCGETYICPRYRAVVQCYSDGACDDEYADVTRDSPYYGGNFTRHPRDGGVPDARVGPSNRDGGIVANKDAGTVSEPGDACDSSSVLFGFGAVCTGCGASFCAMRCEDGVLGECSAVSTSFGDASLALPYDAGAIRGGQVSTP